MKNKFKSNPILYFSFAQHLNLSNYMVLHKPWASESCGWFHHDPCFLSSPLLSCFFFQFKTFYLPLYGEASWSLINMTKWIWIVWYNFLEFHLKSSRRDSLSLKERFLADKESIVTVTFDFYNSCIPLQPCSQPSCWFNKWSCVTHYHPTLHQSPTSLHLNSSDPETRS